MPAHRYRVDWWREGSEWILGGEPTIADSKEYIAENGAQARHYWELEHPIETKNMRFIKAERLSPYTMDEIKALANDQRNWQLEHIVGDQRELTLLLKGIIKKLVE